MAKLLSENKIKANCFIVENLKLGWAIFRKKQFLISLQKKLVEIAKKLNINFLGFNLFSTLHIIFTYFSIKIRKIISVKIISEKFQINSENLNYRKFSWTNLWSFIINGKYLEIYENMKWWTFVDVLHTFFNIIIIGMTNWFQCEKLW